jgi:hypothetical protein
VPIPMQLLVGPYADSGMKTTVRLTAVNLAGQEVMDETAGSL